MCAEELVKGVNCPMEPIIRTKELELAVNSSANGDRGGSERRGVRTAWDGPVTNLARQSL